MFFLLFVHNNGIPGKLTHLSSFNEGIDQLVKLAEESHVNMSREALEDEGGFQFVASNGGYWVIMAK